MSLIERDGQGKGGADGQDRAKGSGEEERVEALIKLKELLDSGVLTEEQYEAEREKILWRA